jgi:hypothetical protein
LLCTSEAIFCSVLPELYFALYFDTGKGEGGERESKSRWGVCVCMCVIY